MRSKLDEFRISFSLLAIKPDIIVLVETNLVNSISDKELGLDD